MLKYPKLKDTLPSLFEETILCKLIHKKSRKIKQDRKSLIFACAYFLRASAKKNFSRGDWTLGYGFMQFLDFPNISLFDKTCILNLFSNS